MFLGEVFGIDGVIIIAVVAVLLFGGAAIPKFAKNLGSAKSQFEKGLKEGKAEATVETKSPDAGSSSTPPST